MKIRKILSLGLVIGLTSQMTLAEDLEPITEGSNAGATFLEGDGIVVPPIPVDPEIDPGEIGPNPNPGALKFMYMLEEMNFGEIGITGQAIDVPMIATIGKKSGKPVISTVHVTDVRGEAKGWEVKARMSDFAKVGNSNVTIDGAQIVFKDTSHRLGTVDSASTLGDKILTPNTQLTIITEKQNPIHTNVSLIWGDGQVDRDGIAGEERNESIRLNIPATASLEAAKYEATITWSIEHTVEK